MRGRKHTTNVNVFTGSSNGIKKESPNEGTETDLENGVKAVALG